MAGAPTGPGGSLPATGSDAPQAAGVALTALLLALAGLAALRRTRRPARS
ncbi:LPXTG cell wall anchor domain-containing protein [Herbiconiux sp. CPCC 203406]|nr:LPXTG cell wall anchor domain-containing protein [Herbiconiux oxytropis]